MNIELGGFKFDDSPIRWEFVPVDARVTSLQQLLARFMENWSYSSKPLGWARNPEDAAGKRYYGLDDVIVAAFGGRFYVVLEKQFREIFGPHPCRLFYQCDQIEETVWVGVLQINAMYHSDERMLEAFQTEVDRVGFYQSPKTQAAVVIL